MTSPIDPFLRGFGNTAVKLPLANVPWLTDMRTRAKGAYEAFGLPTSRLEAWKYTNLNELQKHDFRQVESVAANDSTTLKNPLPEIDAYIIAFINGRFNESLSNLAKLPTGVKLQGLAQAIENTPELLADKIGKLRNENADAMSALNTAYLADGIYLEVDNNVKLDKPVHLISYALGTIESIAFHPRHIIHINNGASATLLESHVGLNGNTLNNSVTEIWVDNFATLEHYKCQNEDISAYHLSCTNVKVGENAIYNNFTLQLGGKIARNEVNCEIAGSHAEAHVNGAYFANGTQHIDNTSFIDHAVPKSNSFETFKGVLDDTASGVFQGKILVRKDAQQSDGQQMSRALLLSRKAEVNAKPELEIYADDVKCSHGATVGELDETQLFYLMARGIDEASARNLLVQAFLYEVLDKITSDDIKQAFHDLIAIKLEGLTP